MLKVWHALFLVGVLALAAEARAQEDLAGPRMIGQGEAVRANAQGSSALLYNPAAMSMARQYVIDAFYGFNVENRAHNLFIGIADSVTSRVAAGLFYSYIHANPELGFNWAGGQVDKVRWTRQGHAAGLSLSTGFGGKFMIGLTAKYLNFHTTSPLPANTTPSKLTQDYVNGVTFDAAIQARIAEKFSIAAIAQNLWDHHSLETPTSLGLGMTVTPVQGLAISFDGVANFTGHQTVTYDASLNAKFHNRVTGRLGPGIEYVIAEKVPIRFGGIWDSTIRAGYITAGVGYQSKQFGIDLGYRAQVSHGVDNFLLLGLRIFVN